MRYSVIIPTYNHCERLLKPCLESILNHTTIDNDIEIIVVANGCTDNTVEYILELSQKYPSITLMPHKEALGYTKATNEGIRIAKGEYIILLNNDILILDSPVDQWINALVEPFKDPKVGITGPMLVDSYTAQRKFLIFFCVMIRSKVFSEIGLLDEIFSPGYGEDTDFCCRLEDAGYKQLQVGNTTGFSSPDHAIGDFPIWHEGNVTFKDWPGGQELINKNNRILCNRYGDGWFGIQRAQTVDGFMSENELKWLSKKASVSQVFIEVGSWHGRSSRAIADNLPPGGRLYCVDHWRGSEVERDGNHLSAAWDDGDHAYMEFCDNMGDHIFEGTVIPIRLSSKNAAKILSLQPKADVIFIDAGHTYEEVKQDIITWLPLLKPGGIFCGHDYYLDGVWPGVKQAVDEILPTVSKHVVNTSIWALTIDTPKVHYSPAVFDCFPFNNELDILEKRFEILYNHVDRFVIVEAMETHSGKKKELVFHNNLKRFEKYLNKVTYGVVEKFPQTQGSVTDKSWARERYQRDAIMNYLDQCHPEDIVIISDCDEIPNPHAIQEFKDLDKSWTFANLEMDLYYYNTQTKAKDKWREAKIARFALLKIKTPCGLRYSNSNFTILNAGNHFSYFGGPEMIIEKIENTAHQEYNTPEMKDYERIATAIKEGKDLFDRPLEFEKL